MRRVFVELPEEEKERHARVKGHNPEYVGLLRECIYGTVDASARLQARQILKEHEFVQALSEPSLFVNVKREIRLLVHGDGEKWFERVLFSKYDGAGKFRAGGNAAMEASFLNRVIRWDPTSGRADF